MTVHLIHSTTNFVFAVASIMILFLIFQVKWTQVLLNHTLNIMFIAT